jgi:hypothetical protein
MAAAAATSKLLGFHTEGGEEVLMWWRVITRKQKGISVGFKFKSRVTVIFNLIISALATSFPQTKNNAIQLNQERASAFNLLMAAFH